MEVRRVDDGVASQSNLSAEAIGRLHIDNTKVLGGTLSTDRESQLFRARIADDRGCIDDGRYDVTSHLVLTATPFNYRQVALLRNDANESGQRQEEENQCRPGLSDA